MARSIRIESIGGGTRGVGGSVSRPVKKSVNKAMLKANAEKTGRRTIGSTTLNKKGQVVEYMSGKKVTGTARKIKDNSQRTELEAKGYSKRASLPKYPSKKNIGNPDKLTTPKVPVKPKASRTRSGKKSK